MNITQTVCVCVCVCECAFVVMCLWVCVCLWVCLFVNLGIQDAMRVHQPLYNNFPHYFVKGTIFEKELFNMKYVFRVSVHLSVLFFALLTTERCLIQTVYRSACKEPDILVPILMRVQFSRQILE